MSKHSELAEEIAEEIADILFKTAHLITEELHLKCVESIDQKLSGVRKFVKPCANCVDTSTPRALEFADLWQSIKTED